MSEGFICVPLLADRKHLSQIEDFTIDREAEYSHRTDKVIGLEAYLKRCAWDEDLNNEVRIYLIKDGETDEVAAYFGLKAGMVASSKADMLTVEEQNEIFKEEGVKWLPEVLPGIEISHFAVNDNYRRRAGSDGKPLKGLGAYFYPEFIYPIIEDVAQKVGVNMIYLYAAGDDKLVAYYKSVFEFQSLQEEDVYVPLEPDYDGGCAFMYRLI